VRARESLSELAAILAAFLAAILAPERLELAGVLTVATVDAMAWKLLRKPSRIGGRKWRQQRSLNMRFVLISGDPIEPSSNDVIAQFDRLAVGHPVPDGWRVLSGNATESEIARVAFRFEIEESR
jgi:hypothetical protein